MNTCFGIRRGLVVAATFLTASSLLGCQAEEEHQTDQAGEQNLDTGAVACSLIVTRQDFRQGAATEEPVRTFPGFLYAGPVNGKIKSVPDGFRDGDFRVGLFTRASTMNVFALNLTAERARDMLGIPYNRNQRFGPRSGRLTDTNLQEVLVANGPSTSWSTTSFNTCAQLHNYDATSGNGWALHYCWSCR